MTQSDLGRAKSLLRQKIQVQLRGLSAETRSLASARAAQSILQQPIWKNASRVLFYAALRDELDVLPLLEEALKAGKIAGLPRFVPEENRYLAAEVKSINDQCLQGRYGILEPGSSCPSLSLKQLDLVLVPGVAFDLAGRRLGRGKGFYDRLLAECNGLKCGVGFDFQLLEEPIPEEPHDIRLDCILTPTRWLSFSGPGFE